MKKKTNDDFIQGFIWGLIVSLTLWFINYLLDGGRTVLDVL